MHAKRFTHNDSINSTIVNEGCDSGFTETTLDSLKEKMIYAKLCYKTKEHQNNEANPTPYVNNLHKTSQANINAIPVENAFTKVIKGHILII